MVLMEKARHPEFWEKFRGDGEFVRGLLAVYERSRWEEIPAVPYGARKYFYETGDRNRYTDYYYRRKEYLTGTAMLALIFPDREEYLRELEDVIWAICEETSWVCPAHAHFSEDGERTFIDLFSGDTAFVLAEISSLLEDQLDCCVRERIRECAEERILRNFESHAMLWERADNNWAATCAFEVGGTLMYLFPDRAEAFFPRLWNSVLSFIGGYSDDGTCLEGEGYWRAGFGDFLWLADLVFQFTDGRVDLLHGDKKDKIAKMAAYGQTVFLKGNSTVSFSDSGRMGSKMDAVWYAYLRSKFPQSVRVMKREELSFGCGGASSNWSSSFRGLYFRDLPVETAEEDDENALRSYDLPDAGQVIVNTKSYSLAVKAGHNDECSGHNDVGHFILSTDAGQVFCDLGYGSYSREYFDEKTRYGFFCAGSQGHSVPIVNGCTQKHGRQYCGTISHTSSAIALEFSKSYGIPGFTRLNRTFEYGDGEIVMTDSFEPDYESITERFVVLFEPVVPLGKGRVLVDTVSLEYDPDKMTLLIHPETHFMPGNRTETAYCIDFVLKPGMDSAVFIFRIGAGK